MVGWTTPTPPGSRTTEPGGHRRGAALAADSDVTSPPYGARQVADAEPEHEAAAASRVDASGLAGEERGVAVGELRDERAEAQRGGLPSKNATRPNAS